VYVAAFAPDKGESVSTLIKDPVPGAPVPPIMPPVDGYLLLDKAKFPASFAGDVNPEKDAFMADSQVPWGVNALGGTISEPAWRTKPSWYLLTTDDKMIPAAAQRLMATLSSCFAILATVLAAVGLYGVIAYMVTRRTREIGIRVALGADSRSLLRLVMREAGMMTAAGVFLAIPLALALTRLIAAQLYDLAPWDPISILAACFAVGVVALFAAYLPAARATRVNPIYALRHP